MAEHYVVQPGDCIASLATARGLFVDTVWNHAENSELKLKRKSPYLLKPGDVVFLPDKTQDTQDCGSEQVHNFVKKGVPFKLRLRLTEDVYEEKPAPEGQQSGGLHASETDPVVTMTFTTKPRANVPYRLVAGGEAFDGSTDGDGKIEIEVPPTATDGVLTLEPGTIKETVINLLIGYLDPIEEISGIKQRLINLGFDCGEQGDEETPELADAIRAFQAWHNLKETGKVDAELRDKLREIHGS